MKKILVAEDDKFLSKAYKIKLTKMGYEVDTVENGEEVITYLDKNVPDLMLLDLMMPIKDGFSVLEDIKKSEKWKKIPVIITSNLGQKEDIDKGMNLGAADYVVKSDLSLEQLIGKIQSILGTS